MRWRLARDVSVCRFDADSSTFLSRIECGVTSTASSSRMNSSHEESKLDMHWPPRRADHFEFDDGDWLMCDREDRESTTIFIGKQSD